MLHSIVLFNFYKVDSLKGYLTFICSSLITNEGEYLRIAICLPVFFCFCFLVCLLSFQKKFLVYLLSVKFLWEYCPLWYKQWQNRLTVYFYKHIKFLGGQGLVSRVCLLDSPLTCVKDWAVTCRERLAWHLIHYQERKGTADLKW